jgi:hypothetical protein
VHPTSQQRAFAKAERNVIAPMPDFADTTTLISAASDAAARLRAWLLHGPAQVRAGAHAGGIAGMIAADGRPHYVYAEITGYYLSWLADIGATESAALAAEPAARAITWVARSFATGQVPATRIYYLDAAQEQTDWRNDAVFFFDLAMLLRGLDAASAARIAAVPDASRELLLGELARFVENDTLRCALPLHAPASLPLRWSTCGGPFLVKASSRVASSSTPLPSALARACARENNRFAACAAAIELGMLHPTLYFAEGLLLARPDCAAAIARLLRRCLDLSRSDGTLPESAGGTADGKIKLRYDIIAQALRVGLLLRESAVTGAPAPSELDRLAAALVARVDPRGFLPFNADTATQANVWCSMFAEQSLRWYADTSAPGVLRPSAGTLV